MKRTATDWLKILILLLPEAMVAAVVLGILWYFDIKSPLWVIILGVLLLGLLAYLTQKVIVPSFHVRQASGREGMIGMEGEVVEALNPTGIVRVEHSSRMCCQVTFACLVQQVKKEALPTDWYRGGASFFMAGDAPE